MKISPETDVIAEDMLADQCLKNSLMYFNNKLTETTQKKDNIKKHVLHVGQFSEKSPMNGWYLLFDKNATNTI